MMTWVKRHIVFVLTVIAPTCIAILYYGFFASGGPEGVGVATGNAVRSSLIVVISVTLLVSLAIYGANGNFNLSG